MSIHSYWVVVLSMLLVNNIFSSVNAFEPLTLSDSPLESMVDLMDTTVDPCDDFYKYACGNFLKQHANATTSTNIDNILLDEMEDKTLDFIKNLDISDKPSEHPLTKVYRMYHSCMDRNEEESLYNLQSMINQVVGNNSFETIQGRSEAFALAHSLGVFPLFKLTVSDKWVGDKVRLVALQPALDLTLEGFQNKEIVDAYRTFIKDLFNATSQYITDQPQNVAQLVFELESALVKIPFQNASLDYKQLKMDYFKRVFGNWINFENVFKVLKINVSLDKISLTGQTIKYYKGLQDLLLNIPTDTLKWYTTWKMMRNYVPFLPKNFNDLEEKFLARNMSDKLSRSEICAVFTRDKMGLILQGHMFPDLKKEDIQRMVSYVRTSFEDVINRTEWLDQETRPKALLNLAAIKTDKIAFPDIIHNDSQLLEYYKFDVGKNFIENEANFRTWDDAKTFAQLQNGMDPYTWVDYLNNADAEYVSSGLLPRRFL
jgi:predicted metalloendopeptidase